MPKTPINKQSYSTLLEIEIRPARYPTRMLDPAPDLTCSENPLDFAFG
jgi:hypothetical protein